MYHGIDDQSIRAHIVERAL
jgi:hypothetical protein